MGTGEKRTLYNGSRENRIRSRETVRATAVERRPAAEFLNARVEAGGRRQHGGNAPFQRSASSRPTFSKEAMANVTSSSVSAAFMIVRMRAFSLATIG